MVLRAPGQLALADVALPEVPAGHVLVRITHSGLCGTDLKIYKGAIPAQYPLIMGHEMVGELAGGERVIVDPVLYCGTCFHCRIGQTNLCPNGGLIGRETNGGFAEYAAVPEAQIFRLPDSVDSRIAPLIQVATTCLHAQRLAQVSLGESVAVIGLGVSGPTARATRQGARRGQSDRDQPQPVQERSREANGRGRGDRIWR